MSKEKDLMDFINRGWMFYEHDGYNAKYITEKDLFDEVKMVFNPIPKIVNIMAALTMQKKVSPKVTDEGDEQGQAKLVKLEQYWEDNDFQTFKYALIRALMLCKEVYVEVQEQNNGEEVLFTLHDTRKVEIKKDGSKIIYAKIDGVVEEFDHASGEFQEVNVIKEYYDIPSKREIIETKGGVEQEPIPLLYDRIPIVEFTTDYDLKPLYDKIDKYNELDAFLNNIFFIHGDPIIWDTLSGKRMKESTKEKMKESRGKALKLLHLGQEGKMGYLEMQGNIAKLMTEEKKEVKDIIANEYPEYILSNVLSQGNPSGETLKVIAIEIISKINSLRGDLDEGIQSLDNLALEMQGDTEIKHNVDFGSILPGNMKETMEIVTKLVAAGLMTKGTGVKKFPELIPDAEEEIKELEEEQKKEVQRFMSEMSEHDADTQDRE
jgi:hypothetical protein